MASQAEIREQITQQIVNALQSNCLPPWRKPWRSDPNSGSPSNVVTKHRYSGVNPILLETAARRHGLQSRYWATYRQWQQLGGQVKRRPADVPAGQWGTNIVFCRPMTKTAIDKEGEESERKFAVLRAYTVFNLDQVDGPFDHLRSGSVVGGQNSIEERYEKADAVIEATGADICFGGDRAFYSVAGDYIQVTKKLLHPWEQPIEPWLHWLKSWTRKGDLIADPFTGSGTIAAAVRQIGGMRRFIGTEIDVHHAKVARARLIEDDAA